MCQNQALLLIGKGGEEPNGPLEVVGESGVNEPSSWEGKRKGKEEGEEQALRF